MDITVDDSSHKLLKKYQMTDQVDLAFLAGPKQSGLTDKVWNMKGRTTTLGGAAPNSARASAHWMKVNKHKG